MACKGMTDKRNLHMVLIRLRARPLSEYEIDQALSSRAPDPHFRPENVENNEQLPLLGRDLESRTPLWKHDYIWIRAPARFARWLLTADHTVPNIARLTIWFSLLATMFGAGILLGIALSRKESALMLLVVELASIVAFVTFTGRMRNFTARWE
jgi:hypothetical protein